MSGAATSIPKRPLSRKEGNKENIPSKKTKNRNKPRPENTDSVTSLKQTEAENSTLASNDNTNERQHIDEINVTEESISVKQNISEAQQTEEQTEKENPSLESNGSSEEAKTISKGPKRKAKTEAQNQGRQPKYIERKLSDLWSRHKCSSFAAVVVNGHIHTTGYGAYKPLANKGNGSKEMDILLRRALEDAIANGTYTLTDTPARRTVPVRQKHIRHDWRTANVHEKKQIYRNVILWNEGGGVTDGKNLNYDLLQHATQPWWPSNLVGPVAYPKDMDTEKLDIVIEAYMKTLSKANLRSSVTECQKYLDGETMPSDLSSIKDALKVHVEGITPVSVGVEFVTDIVPAIERRYPVAIGDNSSVFDAISVALFGEPGKELVPMIRIAVILYQGECNEMMKELIQSPCYPKNNEEIIDCLRGAKNFADCEVELKYEGNLTHVGITGSSKSKKRKLTRRLISFSLMSNLQLIPHLEIHQDIPGMDDDDEDDDQDEDA